MKYLKPSSIAAAFLMLSSIAWAQDKTALIKQYLDMQKPAVERLARSMAEESTVQIARAGAAYLQTRVPAEKRESVTQAADVELRKYVDDAYPVIREKALALAPSTLTPLLDKNFSEDEMRQINAWLGSPVSRKYQEVALQLQNSLAQDVATQTRSSIEPKLETLDKAMAKALGAPTDANANGGKKAPAKSPAQK